MTNNSIQVFAGGWAELIQANQVNSTLIAGVDFPASITWKPDGTKFILLVAAAADFIQEFTVPTPYDTTGAVAGATFNVSSLEPNPRGMYITLDGSRCFIGGTTNDRINQINFGTPWEVSTMSDSGISVVPVGLDGGIQGMTFRKDGLRCYIADNGDDFMEYTLTTPFDLTTFSVIAINTVDISLHSAKARDMVIKPDGKFIYILSDTEKTVGRYFFPILGSSVGMVFVDELDILAIADNVQGLFIRQTDGKKLYVMNGNDDTIYTFDMSLVTNNAIINNDGDELINNDGDVVVAN